MVYVLGRMGSADKALCLIVEGLRDVAQVGELGGRVRRGAAGVARRTQASLCAGALPLPGSPPPSSRPSAPPALTTPLHTTSSPSTPLHPHHAGC